MVMPSTLMLEDICHFFSTKLVLVPIYVIWVARELQLICEGAQHLYHPPRDGDDEKNANVQEENANVEEDDLQILKVI